MGKYTSIGGQALIEGIMMKSPEKTALAVRVPDGEIDITYLEYKSLREKFKILKLPILRGVVSFVESMIQGYKAMMLSAEKSGFADLEEEMVDPEGTIYMVSCSLGRPRDDEDVGLNEDWIGYDYLTEKATYNILDFTEDSITVNSYELGEDVPINTFTIKKTSQNGGHEDTGFFTSIKDGVVRFLGAVYTIFNNFNSCDDLKEHGYNVELSDFFG